MQLFCFLYTLSTIYLFLKIKFVIGGWTRRYLKNGVRVFDQFSTILDSCSQTVKKLHYLLQVNAIYFATLSPTVESPYKGGQCFRLLGRPLQRIRPYSELNSTDRTFSNNNIAMINKSVHQLHPHLHHIIQPHINYLIAPLKIKLKIQ